MNSHAIFGLNPMWLSGIILVIVYIILILEKLNRAVIALFGAMLMIYCGLLNQEQALRAVDFNTLWLLTGMMMLVNITAKTGGISIRCHPLGEMGARRSHRHHADAHRYHRALLGAFG